MLKTGKHYKGISETTTETTSKTTTTLDRFRASSGDPVSRNFVERILSGTILLQAKPGRIVQAAKTYKRSREEVEAVVLMLDQQYRRSTRMIHDATGLLISALRNIELPEANMRGPKQKAHPDENAYQDAEAKLALLSEEEREKIFIMAKAQLHPALRNSARAVKASAVGILMSQARAPG